MSQRDAPSSRASAIASQAASAWAGSAWTSHHCESGTARNSMTRPPLPRERSNGSTPTSAPSCVCAQRMNSSASARRQAQAAACHSWRMKTG